MIKQRSWMGIITAALALAVTGAGCVSNHGPASDGADVATTRPEATAIQPMRRADFPDISLDTAKYPTLGAAIRYIGETYGGGAVLLAGLEDFAAPPLALERTKYVKGIEQLVAEYDCIVQKTPHYVFVYPRGYEALEGWQLEIPATSGITNAVASFAIGAGTDVYNALVLLNDSLDITVVADNVVAETWCGEMFLEGAPVTEILEALLKSARIPPTTIDVESTSEYVLLRSTGNTNRQVPCLNREGLTLAQQALLEKKVTLRLPRARAGIVFQSGFVSLASVVDDLSEQLGVPVTVAESMAELPVNVALFNDVSVETALNLLVWQWPVPAYGYRVVDGGIHFTLRAS